MSDFFSEKNLSSPAGCEIKRTPAHKTAHADKGPLTKETAHTFYPFSAHCILCAENGDVKDFPADSDRREEANRMVSIRGKRPASLCGQAGTGAATAQTAAGGLMALLAKQAGDTQRVSAIKRPAGDQGET